MNKRALYESIMKRVAKEVKKAINESYSISRDLIDTQFDYKFTILGGASKIQDAVDSIIGNFSDCDNLLVSLRKDGPDPCYVFELNIAEDSISALAWWFVKSYCGGSNSGRMIPYNVAVKEWHITAENENIPQEVVDAVEKAFKTYIY